MTVSQATKFLEDAFDVLNKEYFENALPKPIITIQSSPKTNGHFTTQEVWTDTQRKRSYYEINLSAERLNRPIANTIWNMTKRAIRGWMCTIVIHIGVLNGHQTNVLTV